MEQDLRISAEKKLALEAELTHLKTIIRPGISERLMAARALGDLSENAEYQTSRDEQGKNETRIQQIEYILKYAKIVERSGSDRVEMGATVVIQKVGSDEEKTYYVVSDTEADISINKISTNSPIGSAMLGKFAGESFTMTTPRGDVEYQIVTVS